MNDWGSGSETDTFGTCGGLGSLRGLTCVVSVLVAEDHAEEVGASE